MRTPVSNRADDRRERKPSGSFQRVTLIARSRGVSIAISAASGFVAGAVAGTIAGLPGLAAGALFGAAVGAAAGVALAVDQEDERARYDS
jgi:hypothetical protein